MSNERRKKFVDLAQKRTNNAIKQIRLIGNLSNRGNYNYEDKDVTKIVSALTNEIKAMRERFQASGSGKEDIFKLD